MPNMACRLSLSVSLLSITHYLAAVLAPFVAPVAFVGDTLRAVEVQELRKGSELMEYVPVSEYYRRRFAKVVFDDLKVILSALPSLVAKECL